MKALFTFLLVIISLFSNSVFAASTLRFPDWRLSQAEEQVKTFQKESSGLTKEEIQQSKNRAAEAEQKKEWAKVATEYARILGSEPQNRAAWRALSLALQKENKANAYWKTLDDAKYAALNLYLVSKTSEEQAEALLIYGNNFSASDDDVPSYSDIYETITHLSNLPKLREKYPELADFMRFQYQKMEVNNQVTPPSVCFNFSHPLLKENVKPEDYFTISPKTEAMLKIVNRDLCLSPLQFGVNYEVTLKAGLKDIYNEKLPDNVQLNFKVKDRPALLSFKTNAYVLRKEEKALLPLSAVNIDAVNIKILRINDRSLNSTVAQNSDFLTRLWEYSVNQIKQNRGELLYEGSLNFPRQKNETVTQLIPITELIKQPKPGVYIIQAEEKGAVLSNKAMATQWLIVSDIGLTTLTQNNGALAVNARSLKTANALAGIEIKLLSYNNTLLHSLTTDKDGMAFFDTNVTQGSGGNRPLLVLAYDPKGDFSFLSLEQPAFDLSDRGVSGRKLSPGLDAFLYTEQGVYRPGDTLHVNALLRDPQGVAKGKLPLIFKVLRSDEVVVSEQVLTGNELGFYELALSLPSTSRTGTCSVLAYLDPKKEPIGRVQFSVEDFVPSRVSVKLSAEQTFLKINLPFKLQVLASYLFGAPASGLTGDGFINLRARPNPFPKWETYQFGLINDTFKDSKIPFIVSALNEKGEGETILQITKMPNTSKPLEAVIRVNLADKGGRPEVGALTLPVETGTVNLGIKANFPKNLLAETEDQASFSIIAIDNQQNLQVMDNVDYELFEETPHYTWYQPDRYAPWQYQQRLEDKFLSRGKINLKKESVNTLTLTVPNWGQYRLEIRDPKTNASSSIRFNKGFELSAESDSPDKISVRVSEAMIQPNGNVELYIEAPFEGQALLTIANHKILETRNIAVSKKGTRVTLKANPAWETGVYCLVSAFRPLENKSNAQSVSLPKRGVGLTWIEVNPEARLLDVQFELPKETQPRQTLRVPFKVTQTGGKPVQGKTQVSFAAVDEGILKLTEYTSPKPQQYFFGKHRLSLEVRDLYGKLIDPLKGNLAELHVGGDRALLSRNLQALSKRSFKIISLYQGLVDLNSEGRGEVSLKLPDFNGTLRLMAVAFNDKSLGSKDADLLVRDPIVLEAILPRFLSPGDQSQIALSLQNLQAPKGKYQLEILTAGPVQLDNKQPQTLDFTKQDKFEFAIPLTATGLGDVHIRFKLKGNDLNIERLFEITVRPSKPYKIESQTKLLNAKETDKLDNSLLKHFVPETVQVNLSFSSSVPWNNHAILTRLMGYPYGCVEQTTSKAFAALYGANTEKSKAQLSDLMATLTEKQYGSGYFTFWDLKENGGDVFLTAYAMDLLLQANQKGIPIPKFTLERGLQWMSGNLERSNYDNYTLVEIAYALYILTKADTVETGSLRYFFDSYIVDLKNPLANAFIGTALAKRGDMARAKQAFSHVLEMLNQSYDSPYGTYLRDKLILLTLMRESLGYLSNLNELTNTIQSLMGILQNELKETKITQLSTQEMAWAIIAANQLQNPNATVDVQVDGLKQTSASNLNIPLTVEQLKKGITVQNNGNNNLWENLEISGIPSGDLKAESSGIEIKRQYYTLEGKPADLTQIKQGESRVIVLEGETPEPHLILAIDLLPAGFEIENAKLSANNENFVWLQDLSKTEHVEIRDDRYVAALNLDEKKTFRLAYVVRAVTPGNYNYPGFYVEDMYAPYYFARTDSEKVNIVAP